MPTHYLNQCLVIVHWTLRNTIKWNFDQNIKLFIHENAPENIVCEMVSILSRGKWATWMQLYSTVFQSEVYIFFHPQTSTTNLILAKQLYFQFGNVQCLFWSINIMPYRVLTSKLRTTMAGFRTVHSQAFVERCTLVGNKLVDHSDVVGTSPVGAAPSTSSFLTWHLDSMDSAKTTARRDENNLSFVIWCDLY